MKTGKMCIKGVQKGRGFYSPRFSKTAYALLRILTLPYLRWSAKVSGLEIRGIEKLAAAMRRFHGGEARLMILFRHVAKEDASVMVRFLSHELPRWAKKENLSLPFIPHVHFLYGKDVLNWAGAGARWLFPRIGAIPVVNTKMDRQSQDTMRRALMEGAFPLAFAPEGQVTYHMFKVADFTPGAAGLASWAAQEFYRKGQPREVVLLPVSIAYKPEKDAGIIIKDLLERLYQQTDEDAYNEKETDRLLLEAADKVAELVEKTYRSAHPALFQKVYEACGKDKPSIKERFPSLCDAVLRCAETAQGWDHGGTFINRIFRLRYWIMESIYREDIDPSYLTELERNRADFRVLHASFLKRHSETADILEYIDPDYLKKPGNIRRIEFALNLLDVINRLKGGNIDSRYTLKQKKAAVIVGDPVTVSYNGERAGGGTGKKKDQTAALSTELRCSFEQLAEEMEAWLE
jgi:hypothetical protein